MKKLHEPVVSISESFKQGNLTQSSLLVHLIAYKGLVWFYSCRSGAEKSVLQSLILHSRVDITVIESLAERWVKTEELNDVVQCLNQEDLG